MDETTKVILGVLTAVFISAYSQLLTKFFIEPMHDLLKAIGEVRFNLAFHAPAIHTPLARSKAASDSARDALLKSSCDLIAKLQAIPLYKVSRFIPSLPTRNDVEKAAIHLRALSTYVHDTGSKANEDLEQIHKRVSVIEKLLHLKPLE